MNTPNPASDMLPAPARDGHEALLVRHGLITHVAEVSDVAEPGVAEAFQRDASKVARNVIPLSRTRFGILLSPGAVPTLSSIPHRLSATPTVRDIHAAPTAVAPDPALPPDEPPPSEHARAQTEEGAQTPPQPAAGPSIPELADHLAPILDDLITRRLEAMEDNLLGRLASEHPAFSPVAPDRSADFWNGLEAALRLLNGLAERLEAATMLRDPVSLFDTLNEMDSTIGLRFEAAGELLDANHSALEARLTRIDRALAQGPDLEVALAPLKGTLVALAESLQMPQPDLTPLAADLAVLQDALCAQGEHIQGLRSDLAGLSETAPRSTAPDAPTAPDDGQSLHARLDRLTERLESEGGALSETIITARRSIKNFWLANEDTLRRLECTLDRLEEATERSHATGEEGPTRSPAVPSEADTYRDPPTAGAEIVAGPDQA